MSTISNGQQRLQGILGADGRPYREPDSEYLADGFAIPHVLTFGSILSSGWRTYFADRWDEAMRHAREDALAMRRDAFLMSLLEERKLAVARLKWHLEVDDERDPQQQTVRDGLTKVLKATPRLKVLLLSLLEAIWYGRYAVQVRWDYDQMRLPVSQPQPMLAPGLPSAEPAQQAQLTRVLRVKDWTPINGDKLGHHWDGTPYVQVYAGAGEREFPHADMVPTTTGGRGLLLRGSWREKFVIHAHYNRDDGDYFEAEMAEAVFGIGLRTRLFWWDWLKREWLAKVSDWIDRVGLGVSLWYYDASNPKSKTETEKAAKSQSNRTNILVPVFPDARGGRMPGMERLETPVSGSEVLLKLLEHIEEIEERFVVGQQASSRSDSQGLGTHDTSLQEDTKRAIVELDAENLAETLTGSAEEPSLVSTVKRWTFPWADFPVRFVFDINKPDPAEILEAVSKAYEMGVDFKKDEVRALTGLSDPQEGDDVIEGGQQMGNGMPGEESGAFGREEEEEDERPASGWHGFDEDRAVKNWRRGQPKRYDAKFESQHPRAEDGEFAEKGGGAARKPRASRGEMAVAKRMGAGKEARLLLDDGSAAPEHLKASMVPPDWTDVRVALDPRADVLVTARDKAGRVKTVYSDAHHMRQAALKFSRMREGLAKRKQIVAENLHNRWDQQTREEADCTWLMLVHGTRPGSDKDTKAKHQAFGATTLRAEHVVIGEDGSVRLQFVGKEGVYHNHLVRDRQLAEMLRERAYTADQRGGQLFSTSAAKVLAYARTLDGGRFTPKDFRTMRANALAIQEIGRAPTPATAKEYKRAVKAVAEKVSAVLGNRPAQALESYIDPTVFSGWRAQAHA